MGALNITYPNDLPPTPVGTTPHPNILTPISQIQLMEVWLALTCDPGVPNRNTSSHKCKGKVTTMHLTWSSWCCYCCAGPTHCSLDETGLHSLHRQPRPCHWILNLAEHAVDGSEGRLSLIKFFKRNFIQQVKNENEANLNVSPSVET